MTTPVNGSNQDNLSISSPKNSIRKGAYIEGADKTTTVWPLSEKVALVKASAFLVY